MLKGLVAPERWPWVESYTLSFIPFTSDVLTLDRLGDSADYLLRKGAVWEAAERLLLDIAELEEAKAR